MDKHQWRRKIGGASFYGETLANTWYRIAIVVSHSSKNINYYLDGQKVGQAFIGGLIDDEGEHSQEDLFYLFTTDGLSKGGCINSLQFINQALSDSVICDLGGATASDVLLDPTLFEGYAVGLNFGADAPDNSAAGTMDADAAAGVSGYVQQNWNSLAGGVGFSDAVVASDGSSSGITVKWTSKNTWSSTGWGEENNAFEEGGDRTMMKGYLDTGNATTSTIVISDIPAELASYDLIVCALGGVAAHQMPPAIRGGLYWVEDSEGNALTATKVGDSAGNPTGYVEDPGLDHTDEGSYLVFSGLSAANIVVVGTTQDDVGMRAPINGIQLVAAAEGAAPAISVIRNSDGTLTITFEGKLQTFLTVNGPWTDSGKTNPITVSSDEAMLFGRAVSE